MRVLLRLHPMVIMMSVYRELYILVFITVAIMLARIMADLIIIIVRDIIHNTPVMVIMVITGGIIIGVVMVIHITRITVEDIGGSFTIFIWNNIMKNLFLLSLPLLLSACAYDVQSYIPGVPYGVGVTPTRPYYPPSSTHYHSNTQYHYDNSPPPNYHYDNGKHKGQHKKHKHDD